MTADGYGLSIGPQEMQCLVRPTCVLEQICWASWSCGFQIDESPNSARPLAVGHEAVRSKQQGLLSSVEQEEEGCFQHGGRIRH